MEFVVVSKSGSRIVKKILSLPYSVLSSGYQYMKRDAHQSILKKSDSLAKKKCPKFGVEFDMLNRKEVFEVDIEDVQKTLERAQLVRSVNYKAELDELQQRLDYESKKLELEIKLAEIVVYRKQVELQTSTIPDEEYLEQQRSLQIRRTLTIEEPKKTATEMIEYAESRGHRGYESYSPRSYESDYRSD